ncbi:hypothetical protein PIB30_047483 [Stylosanthes scabra]|uniref:GRF-type domain-containing protein n=1 Tax=Stylosanthes scabra TaxID=79078 RepID=A0ABU6RGU0_9FABA|nr:hypothetical protein [Stylosanthes scabra]
MENDGGASSNSRCSRGPPRSRSEQSSETQGCFVGNVGEEKDGVASKCWCGVYAILYRSRTVSNPNRLFFGCPFFKANIPHCKYFKWLDEHLAELRVNVAGRSTEETQDVTEHFAMISMENRVADLELRVAVVEKKKIMSWWVVVVALAVGVVAMWVSKG